MELKKFNDMQSYLVENIGPSRGAFRNFVKQDKQAEALERVELKEGTPKKSNQFLFDYSVIDDIKKDAKTMAKKEILEKYKGKISRAALTRLGLTYGKTLESGRPRVKEGERTAKNVNRANRIRNAQGFPISGTKAKNFHHIFPIGGLAELSPKDVMILDAEFNEKLGGFNLRLNDIADEIATMDLSDPDAVKKLNDLNAESKSLVSEAKKGLPANMKNAIGYVEYSPVFDSNGTIVELSQVKRGVDKNPSALANFGNKKFKSFSDVEKKEFKNKVLELAKKAENKKMMLAAKIPGLKVLEETIKSIPGDFAKAKYLSGTLKVFGVAMTPVMAYDAAKKFEEGKTLLEALEYGFIGTDLIGGTKRVLSLTPEERKARSVVQQDKMDTQIAEDFSGLDSDFDQPRIKTDLKLEDAKELFEKGKKRVKDKEAQKESERATKRSNIKQLIKDKLFPDPTQQIELAGGGIAKQGGVEEGPAPEAGPTPDGLPIDYNNVKKIKE